MMRSLRAIAAPGNRERLRWAVRVRWLVIGGFFTLAWLAHQAGVLPSLLPCLLAAAIGAALNALNHWCVVRWRLVPVVTALAIPADVLLITYLVVLTGGVESPFVMMYVVQVVATAMLVGLAIAAASAVGSAACFAGALLLHRAQALPVPALAAPGTEAATSYQLIWALFLLYCLGLLAYVGGYVSERLRRSEEDLAEKNRHLRRTVESLEAARAELQKTLHRLQATEAQLVLSEKMRALGQFVAGIAHELNNPIGFVSANIEHLRCSLGAIEQMLALYARSAGGTPQQAELDERRRTLRVDEFLDDLPSVLRDCQEGARRAAQIVSGLRAFARGDRGETWVAADLHDGLDRTLALLRHRLGDGVVVEREYGDVPEVACLPGQIDQVFLNLLGNAFDAVGGRGRICIRTGTLLDPPASAARGLHAVIAVRDDGTGIAPEAIDRLFDPFFTTKPEGEGTGLGLSVSYGIVERHGGRITVESKPREGSCFTVYLPVRRAVSQERAAKGSCP
jgi:two-component system NtrC family sensor kinase